MGKLEDTILDILADIIARFIVGIGAAVFIVAEIIHYVPANSIEAWWAILIIAAVVAVFAAIFGLRKGPGVI